MGEVRQKKRQEKEKSTGKKKHSKVFLKKNKSNDKRRLNRRGPQLAPSIRREVGQVKEDTESDNYEVSDCSEGETFPGDVYEYEEAAPEEESRKNHRYDTVDNYDYELPDHFKVSVIILVHCLF